MASLFAYADVGPFPPLGYQRWVVSIAEAAVPAGNLRRRRREAEAILPHLEWLTEGIYDDG